MKTFYSKVAYMKKYIFLTLLSIFLFSSHIFAAWNKVDMGSGGSYMLNVAVGNGRNDGMMRVYSSNADNHLYEFTYSGEVWNKVDLGSGGSRMHSLAVGNGRNDGVMRVYGANDDSYMYEFTYSGGVWSKVDIGSVGILMESVAVGNGRFTYVIQI